MWKRYPPQLARDEMAEKRLELWKSLGLDIDKHGQLMAALPKFVVDLVLSQKNRPKKMDYFDFVLLKSMG